MMLIAAALLVACIEWTPELVVRTYTEARERGDRETAAAVVAPDAKIWFGKKEGAGEPFGAKSNWEHWDEFFHSRATYSDWKHDGNKVSALVHESNDFYTMLEWKPIPYRLTWTVDGQFIREVLLEPQPGKPVSRLDEVKAWALRHHPDELAYLMPKGRIDPTGDRAERWTKLLEEWRRTR